MQANIMKMWLSYSQTISLASIETQSDHKIKRSNIMTTIHRAKTFFLWLFLTIAAFCPSRAVSMECKEQLSARMLLKICGASFSSPKNTCHLTFYSSKQKLYFSFVASNSFDHVFIFRDKLAESALTFYLDPRGAHAEQFLDRDFHPDIREEKFSYPSAVSLMPRAVDAYYVLKNNHFSFTVYLNKSKIRVRPTSKSVPHEIEPEPRAVVPPEMPPLTFDPVKVVGIAKTLPARRLSAETVQKFEGGILIRATEESFYYMKETEGGIYIGSFVNGELVICNYFTHDGVLTLSRRQGALLLADSHFKPFKCHVFIKMPNYPETLFLDVRDKVVPDNLISVFALKENTIRDYFTAPATEGSESKQK